MQESLFIILLLSGTFTFAFGMAWFLPLLAARSEYLGQSPKRDWIFAGADLILILLDCLPLFWLFRAIPELPSSYSAAREKWHRESTIRHCFFAFLVSLALTICMTWIVFID